MPGRTTSSYALFGSTVFLGAFLLFAIQPIVGKQLLPFFGGSSSVWATSLVFFTAALFLGYLYVFVLTKQLPARQPIVHLVAVAVALLAALVSFSIGGVLVVDSLTPSFGVLTALLLSIGAPYVLLATTVPLMQYWYAMSENSHGAERGEPYTLYALSNAASLFALLSYPFLIEPFFSLRVQRGVWIVLFVVYAIACAAGAVRYLFARKTLVEESSDVAFGIREGVVWVLLAALPAFLLVATTTEITQKIAPVPLLWIVPLALYLVTFILAFSGRGQSIYTPLLFFVSAVAAWWFTPAAYDDIVFQILSYGALLFLCGLACHVLLYRMRPAGASSPAFYVLLSLGGAVGVLLASIVAPLVFTDYWEFALGLALSGALSMWILPTSFFPRILGVKKIFITRVLFLALVTVLFVHHVLPDEEIPTVSSRNFYGNAKVLLHDNFVSLMHGTTVHGTQFARPEDARLPTTYFTPGSGVGRAILYEQSMRGEEEMRVGIVGLGTGTIAAYCRPGDTYVFYEIDPRIETIARSYFSYLSHCDKTDVRIGDGRLTLEEERSKGVLGSYDVLAIDAFSDDTIPVHLLTLQAFNLYAEHLRSGKSIIAVHISNRYLDLSPVVFRLAAERGFNAMFVVDSGDSAPGGNYSAWVVLSKDPAVFESVAFANIYSGLPEASLEVWTDDYSSLLPVLAFPKPWD